MKNNTIVVSLVVLLFMVSITSIEGLNTMLASCASVNRQAMLNSSADQEVSKFEEYRKGMNQKQITERLDALALYLKENPNVRAYLVSYAGRVSCTGEAGKRVQLARAYLVRVKGTNYDRITPIDAGYQDEWAVELWTGFRVPTVPTLNRSEVKILRRCSPSRRKRHASL